jgi:DNA (cytosine-5)-methyltransferase 1
MVFKEILSEFYKSGYKYISWRTLNAREFGLPHQRNRVFIVASKHSELCETIFRSIPSIQAEGTPRYCGFYWTAGTQSICYSRGYVPTIKVGSSLSIASPPAVHFSGTVRKLTASEALKLQGFRLDDFQCVEKESSLYRMAGNAVAVPVGRFVVDGVLQEKESGNHSRVLQRSLFSEGADWSTIGPDGYFDGEVSMIERPKTKVLASDLKRFLDLEVESRLSGRAAKGLLKRLRRSNVDCPLALKEDLMAIIEKG